MNWRLFSKQISAHSLAIFFRQFATLMTSGITLVQICEMLEKTQTPYFNALIHAIKKDILAGKTLSFCLEQHPKHFNHFVCQLIHMGEQTGKLEMVLQTIAEQQEKQLRFKKQVRQALFYPCIVLSTACLITGAMFLFVIPKFAILFADMQQDLPLLTRSIFSLAAGIHHYFIPISLMLLCSFGLSLLVKQHFSLTYYFTQLPFLHSQFNKITLIHFARNLALTFTSGIALPEALTISAHASGNLAFIETITSIRSKIQSGLPLYYGMGLSPIFPALMIQMVKIGEESGQLEHMLNKTADFFESDIEQFMKYFTQLLEPLIMLILGVLIGGLILGMYLPIFKLGNAF